jgi:5-methylcytosine-specific restriction endonuclease McrA
MKTGKHVYYTSRWARVRLLALRRDGFKCAECGSRHRLECHHVKPVRTHPELAFDLSNLRTLCRDCHGVETDKELGRVPNLAQRAWKAAVAELARPQTGKEW